MFLVHVPPHGYFSLELALHSANTAVKKAELFIVKLIKSKAKTLPALLKSPSTCSMEFMGQDLLYSEKK